MEDNRNGLPLPPRPLVTACLNTNLNEAGVHGGCGADHVDIGGGCGADALEGGCWPGQGRRSARVAVLGAGAGRKGCEITVE